MEGVSRVGEQSRLVEVKRPREEAGKHPVWTSPPWQRLDLLPGGDAVGSYVWDWRSTEAVFGGRSDGC